MRDILTKCTRIHTHKDCARMRIASTTFQLPLQICLMAMKGLWGVQRVANTHTFIIGIIWCSLRQ